MRTKNRQAPAPEPSLIPMLTMSGIGVSQGIAIGPAHVREAGTIAVPQYRIPQGQIENELARLEGSIETSKRQLARLKVKSGQLPGDAADEIGMMLDAFTAMLSESRLTRGAAERIRIGQMNAEAAVQDALHEIANAFRAIGDEYIAARVEDVREVANRLVRNLTRTPYRAFSNLAQGTIVIAEELSPADTALFDPQRIAGFATALGGPQSHTAIMARSLQLPAVLGVPGLVGRVASGNMVIVDGQSGTLIVNPDAAALSEYRERMERLAEAKGRLARLRSLPGRTTDGVEVSLQANVELPRDLEPALDSGAEGIGLMRTEFLFMNRDDLPDEDEQYEALRAFVIGMNAEGKARPVTIRTLDVGGEKLAYSLGGHAAASVNPALGLRAIRLSLRHPDLLETQFGAILRAAMHGPVRILLPLISSAKEVREARTLLARVAERLRERDTPIPSQLPPLGVMMEVPSAALSADVLARHADYFAIGTNDLTMYTLAIDRSDEQVAALYDPLHPAVLRMIQFAAEAGRRAGIPVSLCGETAGDQRFTALLLGLGIIELSMAPGSLLMVKQRVRAMDIVRARGCAEQIMTQTESGRIAALLDDFNESMEPAMAAD